MPDAQAAHEATLTVMLPALAGANMIYGLGMLDSGLTWDYAQGMMQHEMYRMVRKAVGGIAVTEESIAFDVIKAVGAGGEYITHEHTFENMQQSSQTDLFDRRSREAWTADGSQTIVERAYAKALNILSSHRPEPLIESIRAELNGIFEEAEARAKAEKFKKAG